MAGRETDPGLNQPPPYIDVDLYGTDLPLREAVTGNGAGADEAELARLGRHWGSAEMFELARLADIHPPVLEGEVVSVPSRLSPLHGGEPGGRAAQPDLERRWFARRCAVRGQRARRAST